jgi:hypothetical protein
MSKRFDAVRFQREVRQELSNQYNSDPEAFLRELREKYGNLRKSVDLHKNKG